VLSLETQLHVAHAKLVMQRMRVTTSVSLAQPTATVALTIKISLCQRPPVIPAHQDISTTMEFANNAKPCAPNVTQMELANVMMAPAPQEQSMTVAHSSVKLVPQTVLDVITRIHVMEVAPALKATERKMIIPHVKLAARIAKLVALMELVNVTLANWDLLLILELNFVLLVLLDANSALLRAVPPNVTGVSVNRAMLWPHPGTANLVALAVLYVAGI
jgi:hypothetical protein